MKRILAVAFAALLGALAWLGRDVPEAVDARAMVLISILALFIAVVAAVLALIAAARTSTLHAKLNQLARSIDSALRDFDAGRNRDAAMFSELDERIARQFERFSPPSSQSPEDEPEISRPIPGGNVVPHPATKRARQAEQSPPPMETAASLGTALQRAIATGALELSLQPIVSIAAGAAVGFEVFAHLNSDGGEPIDVRRLAGPVAGVSQTVFERLLVITATEAARRRLGTDSETMPFHLAVTEALFADGDEFAKVLDMLARYPALARSIVISLPSSMIEIPGDQSPALDRLAATGLRFAAEDWSGSGKGLEALRRGAVSFVKLPAGRLLGRVKAAKPATDAATMLEMLAAAGITAIATDVRNDEDAIGLIDLGIAMMTGARFSGPRRLRPEDGGRAERIARL